MELELSDSIYKPKIPLLLASLGNREISKSCIEIVPLKKEEFDFTSFVEFAKLIDYKYFADPVKRKDDKTAHVKVFKLEFLKIPRNKYKYSFHINFGKAFNPVNVFMKYYMNEYYYIYEGETKILIDVLSETIPDITGDRYDFKTDETRLRENSLLFQVSLYFTANSHPCPDYAFIYFKKILHKDEQQTNLSLVFPGDKMAKSISDLLDYCPGYIKVCYQKNVNENEIRYLSIIFPWSLDVLNISHYLEFDGSFFAMRPYTFCLAHGIYFNESLPLSITVAPTESKELYQMIIDHFNDLYPNVIRWDKKTILSDMGGSIQSVCVKNKIKQYFCQRHILQHFGSSSVLAIFANRLLQCHSYHEYIQVCYDVENELTEYIVERRKVAKLTEVFKSKVKDLRIMMNNEKGDKNSNYYYKNWALWVRRDDHVCKCSNHIESMHRVINSSLGNCHSMKKKISNLVDTTISHFVQFPSRFGSSIKRKIKTNIDYISKKLQNPGFDILSLCNDTCFCEEDIYNSLIYGTEIPCQHQLLLPAKDIILTTIKKLEQYSISNEEEDIIIDERNSTDDENKEERNLLYNDDSDNNSNANKNEITINSLIKVIIDQRGFLSQAQNNEIPDIPSLFFCFKNQNFPFSNEELLLLVTCIQNCFKYKIPDIPKIDQNLKIHKKEEFFAKDYIKIERVRRNTAITPREVSKEDEEFWLQNSGTPNIKAAKKAMYETIKEIIYVYPGLRNTTIPFGICFEKYMIFLSDNDEKEILKWIPKFKIACWKAADKHMKNNKFFS